MKSSESKMQEAESFVRKALSHFPDVVIDEDTIKSTALKVSESLPIMEKNVEKHAA